MSFEDLQKRWGSQFPGGPEVPENATEIELMERIRRGERRFRLSIILRALSDLVAFSLISWGFVVAVEYGQLFPKEFRAYRWVVLAGVVLWVALPFAAMKCGGLLAPYSAEGGAALPGRARRDSRRFDAIILWRDLRETVAGGFLVFCGVFQALHAKQYIALDWVAVALIAIPIISFVGYRFRTQAQKPFLDGTVVGTLNLSIYQTRRQVQLLDNLWWYVAPVIVAVILMGPVQGALARGRGQKAAQIGVAVMILTGWAVWKLNRWTARSRLRPRLEQLEKLKSELSIDPASGQP